jgi:shikimate kinase
MTRTNIVLIGMPGAGKSTVGVVLAKRLGFDFLDTDVLIQARQGRRLQEIINSEGLLAFRQIEEAALISLPCRHTVIATGGSAVYSEAGMGALKAYGTIVFLDIPLEDLMLRICDMDTRGMVIDPGETFPDLHARRLPLPPMGRAHHRRPRQVGGTRRNCRSTPELPPYLPDLARPLQNPKLRAIRNPIEAPFLRKTPSTAH